MKYTKEYKLECIRKLQAGEYIKLPPWTKQRKSFIEQVRKWERIYKTLGEAGLEHGRPTLSVGQRLELIKRVESGEAYISVACSAGIGSDLLTKWHKIYMESGIDGLQSLKKGKKPAMTKKPETCKKKDSEKTKEELLKELEYLRAENEYLKKLDALVQKRKAREQKKK